VTARDYVTDEAYLLHDIRQLMAMMLVGSFSEPGAVSAVADPRIREVMEEARADLIAVGKESQAQFKKRLHNARAEADA
jgi:hypothetical protein